MKRELMKQVANQVKNAGYRVFTAESGSYGFYTDADGSRVISLQCDHFTCSVSGNYKTGTPKICGTGWRIAESFNIADVDLYFNQVAPNWALKGATWRYTTLSEHLATYQQSSKYIEV